MKRVYFIMQIVLILASDLMADILFLNNGDEINCKLLSMENGNFVVRIDTETKLFDISDVMKVQIVKEFKDEDYNPFENQIINQLIDKIPSDDYIKDSGYFIKLYETNVSFDENKNVETEIHKIIYVLTEKGKDWAGNAKIYYFPDLEKIDIDYAFSIHSKNIYYLNDVSIQKGDEYAFFPGYNKLKSYKFSVPNVKVGSVIEYKYRISSKYNQYMPFYMTSFFRFYEPAERIVLKVSVPKNMRIAYSNVNMDIKPKVDNENLKTVYLWQVKKQPPYFDEPLSPPYQLYAPQISFALMDTWKNISDVFDSKINTIYKTDDEVKRQIMEITKDKKTDIDKVKSIFYWVSSRINLAPVPMGDYSYIPKDPKEVVRGKSGNYLDKAFLLYVMLKEAGYKPQLIYLTAKETFFKKDVPSIRQFSRAGVRLKIKDKVYYLIPLNDKQKFAQLPPSYQGVWGLVITGKNKGEIFQTPVLSPKDELRESFQDITIDEEGKLISDLVIKPYGDDEYQWRDLKDLKEKERENYITQYITSIHPSAKLISYSIENLDDVEKPLMIRARYRIDDYVLKVKDTYFLFKLPGVRFSSSIVALSKRELPIFFYSKNMKIQRINLSIPHNFEIYHIPQDSNKSHQDDNYQEIFKVSKTNIEFLQTYTRNSTYIYPKDYKDYKKFIENISSLSDRWIVIKRVYNEGDTSK